MWLLVALAALGAIALAVMTVRGIFRRLVLRRLPIVSPAEFALAEPGADVILRGHTAAGQLLRTPQTQRECVYYEHVHVHIQHRGEGSDTTETPGVSGGDARIHDDDGAAVEIAPEVGKKKLYALRDPMTNFTVKLNHVNPDAARGGGAEHFDREFVTAPELPVVAAGRVGPGRDSLDPGRWVTGTATGDVASLGRRSLVEVLSYLCGTAALTGVVLFLLWTR